MILKKIFRLEFFSSWTVKLLFAIFGRLNYSFLSDLKSNLSVHWVYFFISELMQSNQIEHEFDDADYTFYTDASNAKIDAYANLDRTLFIPVE